MESKELKKMLLEKGLTEQQADTLIGYGDEAEKLKGIKREMGSFSVEVDNDSNVVISTVSGWKLVYPPMTNAWVYLVVWMSEWEECQQVMETFVKFIAFPVCNRIEGIDFTYVKNLIDAQTSLDERIRKSMPEPTEEERQRDLELSEAVVATFNGIIDNQK